MPSFQIYKKKTFYWSVTLIVYGSLVVAALMLYIKNNLLGFTSNQFDKVVGIAICIVVVYGFGYKFLGFVEVQPLRGKLEGLLELHADRIIVDGQVYPLDEIRKILKSPSNGFEKSLSAGVDYTFEMILTNGGKTSCKFQQIDGYDLCKAKYEFIQYHKQGKLHFLQLIEVLMIGDYDDIQRFKKELI